MSATVERVWLLIAVLLFGLTQGAAAEADPSITLDAAIARAEAEHPQLLAAMLRHDAAVARGRQRGLPPNPQLSVDAENIGGSGDFNGTGATETTVMLSQTLELGGKRSRRALVGGLEADVAAIEAKVVRADVRATAASTFASVLAAQERLALAEEIATALAQHREQLAHQVAAGKSPAVDLERAEVALASARSELIGEHALLSSTRAALAIVLGTRAELLPRVRGDLESIEPLPDLQPLIDRSDWSRTAVLWQTRLAALDATVDRERARRARRGPWSGLPTLQRHR